MAQCFKEANILSKLRFNMEIPSLRVLYMMMIIGIPKVKTLGDDVKPFKGVLCEDLMLPKGSSLSLKDRRNTCATPRVL